VLLKRAPYDKSNPDATGFGSGRQLVATSLCDQDVRGRYTSDGEWYPFLHESNDGYDTSSGQRALPYSDGRVGMLAAPTSVRHKCSQPSHTRHISALLYCPSRHGQQTTTKDGTYQGGAFVNNGSMNRGPRAWRRIR